MYREAKGKVLYQPGGAQSKDIGTRPSVDANGRPLHYTDEGVANFWRWFDGVGRKSLEGESAAGQDRTGVNRTGEGNPERFATDGAGRPRNYFHGTADDFHEFDLEHPNRKDTGWLGRGVYLTSSPLLAETYSNVKTGSADPRTMPLYAAVHNPLVVPLETKQQLSRLTQAGIDAWTAKVKDAGHDGVALEYRDGTVELVAFDPKKVKSAVGNRGTFDPNDANILAQGEANRGFYNPDSRSSARPSGRARIETERWPAARHAHLLRSARPSGRARIETNNIASAILKKFHPLFRGGKN